jgi:predicted phosphodiesterase
MKIDYISDLHLNENTEVAVTETIVDQVTALSKAIILAGDIYKIDNLHTSYFIKTMCDMYEYVIFVSGNHEYYNCNINQIPSKQLPNNFIYLDNSFVTIDNVTFYGTTLWSNLSEHLNTKVTALSTFLNDFRSINGMTILKYQELFDHSNKFLSKQNFNERSVVITHHLPSYKSLSQEYSESNLNLFFANHILEELPSLPEVWIHGHTHSPCEYVYKKTKVFCNPYGYDKRVPVLLKSFTVG